jgi:hypothetical protein
MLKIIEKLGGRKFLFGFLTTIGFFVLAFFGQISFDELISVIKWIFGIYVLGNVANKITK